MLLLDELSLRPTPYHKQHPFLPNPDLGLHKAGVLIFHSVTEHAPLSIRRHEQLPELHPLLLNPKSALYKLGPLLRREQLSLA